MPSSKVIAWFITEIVPLRSEVPVFGVADQVNDPGPVPLAPAVIVSQLALETAVHGQSIDETDTCTVPVAPFGEMATSGPPESE
jgi:hypothetical protein